MVKAVAITDLINIFEMNQDFTFGGFCCGILICAARYRLGRRRVSVSSIKRNVKIKRENKTKPKKSRITGHDVILQVENEERPEQLAEQLILQPVVVHRLLDVVSILSIRTTIYQEII